MDDIPYKVYHFRNDNLEKSKSWFCGGFKWDNEGLKTAKNADFGL